ncbi:hypothetical protein HYDPIDRAFT_87409, partial [Hydnomerulius pinastri MD-312]
DPPQALGYAFSILLYGILIVQMFIYQTRFSRDSMRIRTYVWVVFVLETASFGVILYALWIGAKMHCLSCAQTELLGALLLWVISLLTGLISVMVHGFYCWRIRVMGRSWYIPILIMLVSPIHPAHALRLMIRILDIHNSFRLTLMQMWMIGSFVCDLIITVETIRLLFRQGGKSPLKETRGLVKKLIKWTLETGVVTTAAMLLLFILTGYEESRMPADRRGVISPGNSYANCLLATLNARLVISNDKVEVRQVSTILFDVPQPPLISEHASENYINVAITQSQLEMGSFTVIRFRLNSAQLSDPLPSIRFEVTALTPWLVEVPQHPILRRSHHMSKMKMTFSIPHKVCEGCIKE